MDLMTIVLVLILLSLAGGGGGYYFGPWRGDTPPNHMVGIVISILFVLALFRLLGVY